MPNINDYNQIWLEFDGATEPINPGGVATYGWLIGENEVLASGYGVVAEGPLATNNRAEWCALGFALRHLIDIGWRGHLAITGDSQLVIYQLSGKYKTNAPHLIKFRDRCLLYLEQLGNDYTLDWVKRECNARADALSQKAYVEHTGKAFPVRRR